MLSCVDERKLLLTVEFGEKLLDSFFLFFLSDGRIILEENAGLSTGGAHCFIKTSFDSNASIRDIYVQIVSIVSPQGRIRVRESFNVNSVPERLNVLLNLLKRRYKIFEIKRKGTNYTKLISYTN